MSIEPRPKAHCSTCQCYTIPSGVAQFSIIEGLIWEVLLRLPTKYLMRFKCVSKLCYSIIRNPKFANARFLHSGGNSFRGLLITDLPYTYFVNRPCPPTFFYADLNVCGPRLMQRHLTIQEIWYVNVTPLVKGLVGLYECENNFFTLCNVATHEMLELPPSPSPPASEDVDVEGVYNYFVGYDPVKEVYKVLCLSYWHDWRNNIYGEINSHVFTLGVHNSDIEWRNVAPPPVDLVVQYQQCLCINGALYWLPSKDLDQNNLTMFHPNIETFETITIPESTKGGSQLVDICGSPALVVFDLTTEYAEAFDVWRMNNHCRGGGLGGWTRARVLLPMGFNHDAMSFNYTGTLPTGEMMLAPTRDIMSPKRVLDIFPLPIYVYDHYKNEMKSITIESQEIVMDSPEEGADQHQIKICYYEENIISLNCLMRNEKQDQTTISN